MKLRHLSAVALFLGSLLCAGCLSPLVPDDEGGGGKAEGETTPKDTFTVPVHVDTVKIVHTGSARDEYTVAEAQAIGKTDTAVWVKGYVVGTVKGSMKSGCQFEPPFSVETNVLLADTITMDWRNCMPVELKDSSIYRWAANLMDNPDIYHEARRVFGTIDTYFGVPGIRDVRIIAPDHPENDENPQPEDSTSVHGESLSDPLSVAEGIAGQGTEVYSEIKYVSGYVVGVCTGKGKVAFADTLSVHDITTNGNVVLADSIGESDLKKVLVVQLPKGCIRDDVSLAEHPENLFRRLTACGKLMPYWSLPGLYDVLGTSRRTDAAGNPLYLLE